MLPFHDQHIEPCKDQTEEWEYHQHQIAAGDQLAKYGDVQIPRKDRDEIHIAEHIHISQNRKHGAGGDGGAGKFHTHQQSCGGQSQSQIGDGRQHRPQHQTDPEGSQSLDCDIEHPKPSDGKRSGDILEHGNGLQDPLPLSKSMKHPAAKQNLGADDQDGSDPGSRKQDVDPLADQLPPSAGSRIDHGP